MFCEDYLIDNRIHILSQFFFVTLEMVIIPNEDNKRI